MADSGYVSSLFLFFCMGEQKQYHMTLSFTTEKKCFTTIHLFFTVIVDIIIVMVKFREVMSMEKTNATIAICDDEQEVRSSIEKNIRLLYENVDIIQFGDGKALVEYGSSFDILFLDIQMEGMSGMEAARELRKSGCRATIIFVTAIEEYVFEAFDVGAFHYILKPFDKGKFFQVLRKAMAERESINAKEAKAEPSIAIKTGAMTKKIYLYKIIYLEVFNRKVVIHKTDGDIEFYGKLIELEGRLSEDFVRCHRAYIVNLRYVLKYTANSITLENGTEILLSKQKYGDFVRKYLKYISRLISS
ncbi:DNA-binding response regulator [Lachnospiraceae bacterium]|nr:DNA-binding response regulator [Lachnospiraceae bacterium]